VTLTIEEVFWTALCSCGWSTDAKNEAEVAADKVRNHVLIFHKKDSGVRIGLISHRELRTSRQLPAMGVRVD
jgi:hypothetical protein